MAGLDRDVGRAHLPGAGHREQPEGARSDHRDPGVRSGPGEPEGVPGNGCGLDERGVAHVEAGRELDEALRRSEEGISHPAVGRDAERPLGVGGAQVVAAGLALGAPHAAVDGLDHDRGAVLAYPGELVTEDVAGAEGKVEEVGTADAGGLDAHQLAGLADARRRVQIDDCDAVCRPAHRSHRAAGH